MEFQLVIKSLGYDYQEMGKCFSSKATALKEAEKMNKLFFKNLIPMMVYVRHL